jgi:cyanate lyase
MTRADLTEKILDIKREKEWSWKHIHDQIGGTSPVLLVGALLGHMKLTKPQAANAAELFGLSKSEAAMLNEVPMRGAGVPMPPTDPLIYRFYELVMVNGPAWKALIEEEFASRSPCRANSSRSNITGIPAMCPNTASRKSERARECR